MFQRRTLNMQVHRIEGEPRGYVEPGVEVRASGSAIRSAELTFNVTHEEAEYLRIGSKLTITIESGD